MYENSNTLTMTGSNTHTVPDPPTANSNSEDAPDGAQEATHAMSTSQQRLTEAQEALQSADLSIASLQRWRSEQAQKLAQLYTQAADETHIAHGVVEEGEIDFTEGVDALSGTANAATSTGHAEGSSPAVLYSRPGRSNSVYDTASLPNELTASNGVHEVSTGLVHAWKHGVDPPQQRLCTELERYYDEPAEEDDDSKEDDPLMHRLHMWTGEVETVMQRLQQLDQSHLQTNSGEQMPPQ